MQIKKEKKKKGRGKKKKGKGNSEGGPRDTEPEVVEYAAGCAEVATGGTHGACEDVPAAAAQHA